MNPSNGLITQGGSQLEGVRTERVPLAECRGQKVLRWLRQVQRDPQFPQNDSAVTCNGQDIIDWVNAASDTKDGQPC